MENPPEVSHRDGVVAVPRLHGTLSAISPSDEPTLPSVRLSWHNIVISHRKSGRQILNGVSGVVRPSRLLALMGASGAGKTTLLNSLVHRNLQDLKVTGNVLIDGHVVDRKAITQLSGYVQQEELFVPTLTVKEHLIIQARLRLVGLTQLQRERRVDELMTELGLMKCRNSRIGRNGLQKGISGGESKRLSFASELLTDPPLLFADEPTTGLDSAMAESVITTLRHLAERRHTVICTIHQPSATIFNLFHHVMFLAAGRVAYQGPPSDCVPLFASIGYHCGRFYNPADMIVEVLASRGGDTESQERIQKICDQFEQSSWGKEIAGQIQTATTASEKDIRENIGYVRPMPWFHEQIYALFIRSAIDNVRNPAMVKAKLALKIFMGLFVGLLYLHSGRSIDMTNIENINGAMFYFVNELTYATVIGVLTIVPEDYPLILREYNDGLYHLGSYYVARCLSFVPLFTLDGLLMICIAYFLVGLVSTVERMAATMGIGILIEQAAAAFGIMVSTCSPSFRVAVSVAAPLLTVLSLTGGMYANVDHIPVYIRWLQYCSWFRYGFEALLANQWNGVADLHSNGCLSNSTICITPSMVLDGFAFDPELLGRDVGLLALLIFIFYFIGFIGLWIRVWRCR